MSDKLTKIEPQQAIEKSAGITIEQAFQAAASKSLDKESLEVMKQLLAMDAVRKFNEAFVRLQSQLPVIVASSTISNRGKYERYEDIMDKDGVGKILADNGFTVSFDQDFKDNRIIVTCLLAHVGGHTRPNRYATRVGGKSDSETQADSKASTTAKRNALIQALNLTIRQDILNSENDASLEGDPDEFVTKEQAAELERRVAETNSDRQAFLKFANSDKFATIQANRYPDLDASLRRKEKAGK